MLVSQILKSKADDAVVTVSPSMLISQAAQMLSEKRIGALLISSDGGKTAQGILSERDIVRELGKQGAGCLDKRVEELMTTKLITCGREDRADAILQQMTDGRFRHMPVVKDGTLIGLISLGDVVKARLSELSMEKEALQGMIMGH